MFLNVWSLFVMHISPRVLTNAGNIFVLKPTGPNFLGIGKRRVCLLCQYDDALPKAAAVSDCMGADVFLFDVGESPVRRSQYNAGDSGLQDDVYTDPVAGTLYAVDSLSGKQPGDYCVAAAECCDYFWV